MTEFGWRKKSDTPIERKVAGLGTGAKTGFLVANGNSAIREMISFGQFLKFGGDKGEGVGLKVFEAGGSEVDFWFNLGGVFENPVGVILDEAIDNDGGGKEVAGNVKGVGGDEVKAEGANGFTTNFELKGMILKQNTVHRWYI